MKYPREKPSTSQMLTYNPVKKIVKLIFQIRMGRDYSKYYIYDTTIHTYMPSIQSSLKKNDSFTLLMNRKY